MHFPLPIDPSNNTCNICINRSQQDECDDFWSEWGDGDIMSTPITHTRVHTPLSVSEVQHIAKYPKHMDTSTSTVSHMAIDIVNTNTTDSTISTVAQQVSNVANTDKHSPLHTELQLIEDNHVNGHTSVADSHMDIDAVNTNTAFTTTVSVAAADILPVSTYTTDITGTVHSENSMLAGTSEQPIQTDIPVTTGAVHSTENSIENGIPVTTRTTHTTVAMHTTENSVLTGIPVTIEAGHSTENSIQTDIPVSIHSTENSILMDTPEQHIHPESTTVAPIASKHTSINMDATTVDHAIYEKATCPQTKCASVVELPILTSDPIIAAHMNMMSVASNEESPLEAAVTTCTDEHIPPFGASGTKTHLHLTSDMVTDVTTSSPRTTSANGARIPLKSGIPNLSLF